MTDFKYENLESQLIDTAKRLLEQDGFLVPTLLLKTKTTNFAIELTFPPEEKEQAIRTLINKFKPMEVLEAYLISEARVTTTEEGEEPKVIENNIIITYANALGQVKLTYITFEKNKDNKIIYKEPVVLDGNKYNNNLQSWLTELFYEEPKSLH